MVTLTDHSPAATGASSTQEIEALCFRALARTELAFMAVGRSGVVLFASEGLEKLLDQRAEEMVGQSLIVTLPELQQSLTLHERELRAGRVLTVPLSAKRPSGAVLTLTATVSPGLSDTGEVVAGIVSLASSPTSPSSSEPQPIDALAERATFGHELNNVLATIETYTSFVTNEPLTARQLADLTVARDAARRGGQLADRWASGSPLLATEAIAAPGAETPERAGKTLLVVEDDAILRDGLRRLLEAQGHHVLEAADGVEAADVAARHPEPIHVLVTDLVLPRASGLDAFERVRVSRPDIRAVFVSGRLDTDLPLPEGTRFVHKPFAAEELTSAIESLLESAPPDLGRLFSANPVVLVVDDDDQLRNAFARVIEECEFVALTAKSGLHALKVLSERHVDVVISDHFMPGMDGVRLLELVRERFGHCVRVLFTAHASSDIVLDAVNRGGVHKVLVKSMHAVAIRDEIERAVLDSDRFRLRAGS